MVVCHGEYWAGNVLVDRGRVSGVADWERAMLEELPLWDLAKALGSAAYHLDRYRSLPRRGPAPCATGASLGPGPAWAIRSSLPASGLRSSSKDGWPTSAGPP
jgi:hypothetical protein